MVKVLYLYLDSDNNDLQEYYREAIKEHNYNLYDPYMDSGFDLCSPNDYCDLKKTFKVNFQVKCGMFEDDKPLPFYLYPRSSISKTNFRLANSVGIIDSGYRGDICAYFDMLDSSNLEYKQRLVQICSSTLEPFQVILLDNVEFFETTTRGKNGFGSSGK
jgi:dUTP pyrophosphatase